jgi:hypothetical protein
MILDSKRWSITVLICYDRKHTEETEMSVEEMNNTGGFQ